MAQVIVMVPPRAEMAGPLHSIGSSPWMRKQGPHSGWLGKSKERPSGEDVKMRVRPYGVGPVLCRVIVSVPWYLPLLGVRVSSVGPLRCRSAGIGPGVALAGEDDGVDEFGALLDVACWLDGAGWLGDVAETV